METFVKPTNHFNSTMVVLTSELKHRLDMLAQRRTMSRSLLIREACERLLKDYEEKEGTA